MAEERKETPEQFDVQTAYEAQLRRQAKNRLLFGYPVLALGSAALIYCACRYGSVDDFCHAAKIVAVCGIALVSVFVVLCAVELWRWRK